MNFFELLLVFIVGSIIVSYLVSPTAFDSFKKGFEDLKNPPLNPSTLNQSQMIAVSGTLVGALDRIKNSDGYIFILGNNCLENSRVYDYQTIYTAKGKWVGGTIQCSTPIK